MNETCVLVNHDPTECANFDIYSTDEDCKCEPCGAPAHFKTVGGLWICAKHYDNAQRAMKIYQAMLDDGVIGRV